ncbi:acyl-CoA thioesterase family protein [Amycolatopsis aidingensis]|uniref:hypothetical protein n=1 Tax=Amycolatopsis aidingensis TaxID=2842453 RepID=UPI001C0B34B8|nr:hypothetical protein [Amycolatopsis aidingensis]
MTTVTPTALHGETTTSVRPGYEGLNINSWIGFKHINYLVEEAVLEHFRVAGISAHTLFEDYGLCVELVAIDTRISTAMHTDDLARAVVRTGSGTDAGEISFTVTLFVRRGTELKKAAMSSVQVTLRRDGIFEAADEIPDGLSPFVTNRVERRASGPDPCAVAGKVADAESVLAKLNCGTNAFAWRRRVPYFYCHFSERLQLSGYLRQLEEAVDLFLADRGVSIKRLLDEQRWIPLVTHSSMSMLTEVVMEEELYTVFTVEDIFKSFHYTARMDTYVLRNGEPHRTATGRITHAYGEILNRGAIKIVQFDRRLLAALRGE